MFRMICRSDNMRLVVHRFELRPVLFHQEKPLYCVLVRLQTLWKWWQSTHCFWGKRFKVCNQLFETRQERIEHEHGLTRIRRGGGVFVIVVVVRGWGWNWGWGWGWRWGQRRPDQGFLLCRLYIAVCWVTAHPSKKPPVNFPYQLKRLQHTDVVISFFVYYRLREILSSARGTYWK